MVVVHVYFMARFFWRVCIVLCMLLSVVVSFILRYFLFVQLVITMTTFDSNVAKYLKIPVNFHTHSIKSSHICSSNADISCRSHPQVSIFIGYYIVFIMKWLVFSFLFIYLIKYTQIFIYPCDFIVYYHPTEFPYFPFIRIKSIHFVPNFRV